MNATINPTAETVAERLQLCLPRLPLAGRGTTSLIELGLDSIDSVELLCVIHEEFGVRLSEADFAAAETLDGLMAIIARKASAEILS